MRSSGIALSGRQTIAPRRALSDEVHAAINALLLDGKFEPGVRVNIDSVARELGVSATPVREALARLESEGLLVKEALRGYTVAPLLDAADMSNLFELRLLLEPAAAASAADHATDGVLRELDALAKDLRAGTEAELTRSPDRARFRQYVMDDAEFHGVIAAASGNPLLADAIDRLHAQVQLYRIHFPSELLWETNAEHEAILTALRAGDPMAAREAMRAHLERSRKRLAVAVATKD